MSTEERLEGLIHKMLANTREGRLEWKPAADEDTFRATFQAGNISVKKSEGFDQEEMQSYELRSLCVFNEKGRLIEEYAPTYQRRPVLEAFDELFTLARRSAFKTDGVLDALISEIDGEVAF
ncbi:MAG: hypothetical protein AABP62_28940 [Planctomycetota bacterium]